MAGISRKEFEKLDDENRVLCQKLSDAEMELTRKDEALKTENIRKKELLSDLRECQRKVKELSAQLEKVENSEQEAKSRAHHSLISLEQVQSTLKDQTLASKMAINSFQMEIKAQKARFAEKEKEHEALLQQLNAKDMALSSLEGQRSRGNQKSSSQLANLHQMLTHSQQDCQELTGENKSLKQSQQELLKKLEDLEKRNQELLSQCQRTEHVKQMSFKQPPKVESAAPTATVRPIPEETEMDALVRENSKLKQDLLCLQTNFQLTAQKSARLKEEKKELDASLEQLGVQNSVLAQQNEELLAKYQEVKTALGNKSQMELCGKGDTARLQKEIDGLRGELACLEEEKCGLKEKLRKEVGKNSKASHTLAQLEEQGRRMKGSKAEAEQQLTAIQARLRDVEDELTAHKQSSASQQVLQQQSTELIGIYEKKLGSLREEGASLESELAKARQMVCELKSKVEAVEKTNASLRAKASDLETLNKVLTGSMKEEEMASEVEEMRKQLMDVSEQNETLTSRNKELVDTQVHSAAQIQELTKAGNRLRREANHNWDLVKKLQKDLEKAEMSLMDAQESLERQQDERCKMASEIANLESEIATLKHAKEQYEEEADKLVQKVGELETVNFEVSSKLSEHESAGNTLRMQFLEAQQKAEELEKRCKSSESVLVEKQSHVSELVRSSGLLEKENSTLLTQVNSLSEMVAARNLKIESLQSQVSQCDQEGKEIASRVYQIELEHGSCAKNQQRLEEEISSLKESLFSAQEEKREGEKAVLGVRLEVKQLQEYNSSLEAINNDLQGKLTRQMTTNEELSSTQYQLQQSIETLQQEAKCKAESLRSTLSELEGLKRSSEDEISLLREKVESLELKCRGMEQTREETEREGRGWKAEVRHLENRLREEQQFSTALKADKQRAEEMADALTSELGSLKDQLHQRELHVEDLACDLKQRNSSLERENRQLQGELEQVSLHYDKLKDSAMVVLDSSSEEKTPKAPGATMPKGILKKKSSKTALQSVENIK